MCVVCIKFIIFSINVICATLFVLYVSYYLYTDCINRVICVKNDSWEEFHHLIIIFEFMQFHYLERQVHVERILLLRVYIPSE